MKSRSDAERVLAKQAVRRPPVQALPLAIEPGCRADRFARLVVANCLEQVLANAGSIEHQPFEAEHVHQLRVGLRRLRIAITELAELNARIDVGWEPVLAGAFRSLGMARDRELILSVIQAQLVDAGAPPLPDCAWPESPDPLQVVQQPLLQATLLAAQQFAGAGDATDSLAFDGSPLDALVPRLEELHRSLRKSAKNFSGMSAKEQHRVRKRLKRLRYLAEFVAPWFGRSTVRRYIRQLRSSQEALGRLNDYSMALDAYIHLPSDWPGKWFAIGWLRSQRQAWVKQSMEALAVARKGSPFWRLEAKP